ncbi:hypothetical protein GW7_04208 [Heterocephalus glaber]|uniref:Uncharacterized protein n=1 Tax=Heterocephalus glaber TaxID=10181 RepID=G5C281_HETGA|nr:hypothetical protein GW7_04208 [Heterocephalus glaber]
MSADNSPYNSKEAKQGMLLESFSQMLRATESSASIFRKDNVLLLRMRADNETVEPSIYDVSDSIVVDLIWDACDYVCKLKINQLVFVLKMF